MTNEIILHYAYWFLAIVVVTVSIYGIYLLWGKRQEYDEIEEEEVSDEVQETLVRERQYRRINKKADLNSTMYNTHVIFWYCALAMEFLTVSNAISWAWWAYSGGTIFDYFMRLIFVITFTGLVVVKIYSIPILLKSYQEGHGGLFTASILAMTVSIIILFFGAFFHLINISSTNAHERTAVSAPVVAVDLDIGLTREKLNGLARFADESGVQTEYKQNVATTATHEAKIKQLQAVINNGLSTKPPNAQNAVSGKTLAELTGNCSNTKSYYYRLCQQIQLAKAELAGLGITGATTPYANGHQEYMGLKARLVDLEKRRAELLQSGAGVESWPAHVRWLASMSGATDEKSSWFLWFILSLIFDGMGLVLRYVSTVSLDMCDDNSFHKMRATIQAYQTIGINPVAKLRETLDNTVFNNAHKEIPAYKDGGHVPKDGVAYLHAGEYVMPAEAVRSYGKALLEELRDIALRKTHEVDSVVNKCSVHEESVAVQKCNVHTSDVVPDGVYKKTPHEHGAGQCKDVKSVHDGNDPNFTLSQKNFTPPVYTENSGVQECTLSLQCQVPTETVVESVGDSANSEVGLNNKAIERNRIISHIKKLLRDRLSKTAIAKRLGISRTQIYTLLREKA